MKTTRTNLRKWIVLLLVMLAALLPVQALLGVPSALANIPRNEQDGSKIEGIDIFWITPDSTVDNNGNAVPADVTDEDKAHLFLATDSNAELQLKYQIEVSFSGQYDYAPGDITITIPAQIWHGRQYEGGEGVPAPGVRQGGYDLPLPEAPSTRAEFNWQIINGDYVLTNTKTIGATSKAMFQFTITGINPYKIPDMSLSDYITAHCEVVTNKGNVIELTSNPIMAQLDTIAKITGATKSGELFEERPPELPSRLLANLPEGTTPADYLYVCWNTSQRHVANQPFSLSLVDQLGDVYVSIDGVRSKVETQPIMLGYTGAARDGEINATGDGFSATAADGYVTCWSAYKKSDIYEPTAREPQRIYYFTNDVEWTLTEDDGDFTNHPSADGHKVTTAAATATVTYQPMAWYKPVGRFEVFKYTIEDPKEDHVYGYSLNRLANGEGRSMEFDLKTVGFGFPWTSPRTNPEDPNFIGEDWPTIEDFGLLGWRQTTEDFDTFFNANNTPLTSRDFEITYMKVVSPTKFAYKKAKSAIKGFAPVGDPLTSESVGSIMLQPGQWGYISSSLLPNPDLVIEYQLDGGDEWLPAATAQWGSNGRGALRFVDVAEGITTSGNYVYFPENTTDVRHTFVSNVYGGQIAEKSDLAAVIWHAYLGIDLKPSAENVKIAQDWFKISDTPSTKFKNDVHMEVDGWIYPNEDGTSGEGTRLNHDEDTFYDSSRATLTGAGYGVKLTKNGTYNPANKEQGGDNDTENRQVTLHYSAELTEQSNITDRTDYNDAVAAGVIPAETKGVWYDLLPEHVVPVMNSIRVSTGERVTSSYMIPNYRNSGRILLVVEVDMTPTISTDNVGNLRDTSNLYFDAVISWDHIDDEGTNLVNYIAFESLVDNLVRDTLGTFKDQKGEPDNPRGGNNFSTPDMPDDIAQLLTGLDPNTTETDNRFLYGKVDVNLNVITYAVSGIEKTVQDDLVGLWTQGLDGMEQVTVYEGHNYSYKLRVSSADSTQTSDIIVYDTLENYHIPDPANEEIKDATKEADFADKESKKNWQGDWQGVGQWRGSMLSVDLSNMIEMDVAPVLYYSLVPDLQFADSPKDATQEEKLELFNSGSYDISNTNIWNRADLAADGTWTVPEDLKGKIMALAIDARTAQDGTPFVLAEGDQMYGLIHMVAPDDEGDPDVWHAKGAYAHKLDADGNPLKEVDWEKALDKKNNMYAFNNTRLKCIQTGTGAGGVSSNMMIRNDYTRVGILPGVVDVEKEWDDWDNHDNIRPEEVTVALLRKKAGAGESFQPVPDKNGQPLTATLSEANSWKTNFVQLDMVDDLNRPYSFTFEELAVDGYTSTVTKIDDNTFKIVNEHEKEKIRVNGVKQWNDNDNEAGARPSEITLRLLCDGEEVDKIIVTPNAKGEWAYDFGMQDKYAYGGVPRVYTVVEEEVPKYVFSSEDYSLAVNDYYPYGDLALVKTLKDATPGAAEKEFTFTFTFLDEKSTEDNPKPLAERFRYEIFQLAADGETWEVIRTGEDCQIGCSESVTLKGDQKIVIYSLPACSIYKIEEAELDGFTLTETVNAEGTIPTNKAIEAEFTNTYRAVGGVQINAFKQQEGHKLRKSQHKFQLIDKNEGSETYGEVIRTGYTGTPTNSQDAPDGGIAGVITAHAIVSFGRLNYTHLDDGKTFYYEVVEVNEEKPGYTYDDTRYTVKVTVSDNADGTLTVTAVDAATGKDVTTPEGTNMPFENRYNAEGAVTLKAWKTLDKRMLEEGEFTFELYACNVLNGKPGREPIATAKNDAEGNIVFAGLAEDGSVLIPELVFDQDDVSMHDDEPAKYSFIIKEVYGTDKTVAYTDQVYKYEVTVYDNHDGTLSFVEGTQSGTREWLECEDCHGSGKTGGTYVALWAFDYDDGTGEKLWIQDVAPNLGVHDKLVFENVSSADLTGLVGTPNPVGLSCRYTLGFMAEGLVVCPECSGSGLENEEACTACKGSGYSSECAPLLSLDTAYFDNYVSYQSRFAGFVTADEICIGSGMTLGDWAPNHKRGYALFESGPDQDGNMMYLVLQTCHSGWDAALDKVWREIYRWRIVDSIGMQQEDYMACCAMGGDPLIIDTIDEIVSFYSYCLFYSWEVPSHITSNISNSGDCTTCGGEGRIEGGFTVDGEASMPVFQNDIKPGNLTVTKKVSNDPNPHPEQAFTFKVKFIGDLSATPDLTIRRPTSVEDDPALAPKPVDTTKQFHATEEQLQGDPYAVLDKSTGELVIFRSADGTDHLGRAFDKNTDKWQNGSLVYFTLSETKAYAKREDWGWSENSGDVRKITMAGAFRPVSTHSMFHLFQNVAELDLHLLDTSHTVDMDSMFCYFGNVKLLDLRTFDTSAVTKFGTMFAETKAERIDLSSFDTSKATTLANMFGACRMLKELDLRNFDTSKNTSCWWMIRELTNIEYINFGDFDMSKVTNTENLFYLVKPHRVTLTDKTKFPVYIDADATFPYDGTWVNVDDPSLKLTGEELFTEGGHGGTWMWNQPKVKINFLRGEGAGSMQSDEIWWEDDSYSFVPAFYRFGYELTGFKDAKGATHAVDSNGLVTINPQDCHQDYVVDLTAVWTPLDEDAATDTNVAVFTLKDGETATFKDLPAYLGYEVWEETPAGWVLVEKVNDAGEIKPTETIKAVFTNEYAPDKAQAALSATKLMDGKGAAGDAFSFKITGPDGYTETVKNVAGGTVQFTPFNYDLDDRNKTYSYTITEVTGNDSTIAYDNAEYTATVEVKDNGEGLLTAVVTYNTADGKAPVFRNTTKPGALSVSKQITGATPIATQQTFTVEVTFTDAEFKPWAGIGGKVNVEGGDPITLENGKATFTLMGGNTVTLINIPAGIKYEARETGSLPGWTMDGTVEEGKIKSTVTDQITFENSYAAKGHAAPEAIKALEGRTIKEDEFTFGLYDADGTLIDTATTEAATGKVVFDEITYTVPDVYTYTIKEIIPDEPDDTVEYSSEIINVTITVMDEDGEGRLTAAIGYDVDGVESNTITNKVKPGSLQIAKTVVSSYEPHAETAFTFTVYVTDAMGQLLTGDYAMDNGETLTLTDGSGTLTLKGGETVTINGLPDGASYSVVEAAEAGFTQQQTGATGKIWANQTAEAAFTNTYHAKGEYTFTAVKTLEGKPLEEDMFLFELQDSEGYKLESTTNDADGNVAFSALRFTEEDVGEKRYTVLEKNTGAAGITYDTTRYEVTLTITDNGDGTLSVDAEGLPEGGITFLNTFGAETDIEATKEWVGDEDNTDERVDITFVLYSKTGSGERTVVDEKIIPADATGDALTVKWEQMPLFNDQGVEIEYSLEEIMEIPEGEKNLYVSGVMGSAAEGFTVINRFATTEVTLEAEKELQNRSLEAGQFTFLLKDENGEVVAEAKNDANGRIVFPALVYNLGDLDGVEKAADDTRTKVFTYTITEVDEAKPGYTYDDITYYVDVTLTEDAEGTLTATAELVDQENALFINVYEAEGRLVLEGSKTVNGAEPREDQVFTFRLMDEAGDVIEEVSNTKGTFAFAPVYYTHMDIGNTYTYTVCEVEEEIPGYTADAAVYTVIAEVADAGDGTLTVTQTIAKDGAAAEAIAFDNLYEAEGELVITATKTVNGAEPTEDQVFTFELKDAEGNLLQSKENESGSITFDAIAYDLDDAGKTFTYTVSEAATDLPGFTADAAVYTVTAEVADAMDGTLTVTQTITKDGAAAQAIAFDNLYEAEGELVITATKTVNGAEPTEDQVYTFELADAEGNVLQTKENEKGTITFDAIAYDLDDAGKTYTYTVKETTPATDSLLVDESIYTVTAEVTDAGDGTLTITKTITKGGEAGEDIIFHNRILMPLTISKKVTGTVTEKQFTFTVELLDAEGNEAEGEYAYTGDLEGKLKSGDTILLGHDESITIAGLEPGMTYRVTETTDTAYVTTVNGSEGVGVQAVVVDGVNEVNFVNHMRTTEFSVTKRWSGGGSGPIELTLYANGKKMVPQPTCVREGDTYTYSDLPMYDDQNQAISYYAKERYVDGFITIYDNVEPFTDVSKYILNGGTIINKAVVKADFTVTKLWKDLGEGETAPDIELVLYCNGEATDIGTPNPDRNGRYKYYDLPDYVDGVPAVYTVKEVPVEGFDTRYTLADGTAADHADNGGTITNVKLPQTGDNMPLALLAALMGASAIVLMLLMKRRKA
ncbi:MAG: Cna B-type domain-containing protein [Clostridia bacterium]|nr:Cna B-type domain-containing protein [Clostridia bacterium]